MMAYYALLDENNIVTQVISGKDEGEDGIDWEVFYGNFYNQTCKRTSWNTRGNVHNNGGTPFRGNYAGIDYTYRSDIDAFIEPQPFPSWTLNSNFLWQPPIAMPTDGKMYSWDEVTQAWVEVNGN